MRIVQCLHPDGFGEAQGVKTSLQQLHSQLHVLFSLPIRPQTEKYSVPDHIALFLMHIFAVLVGKDSAR